MEGSDTEMTAVAMETSRFGPPAAEVEKLKAADDWLKVWLINARCTPSCRRKRWGNRG